MRSTERTNGRLLSVRRGRGDDRWEAPAGDGPVKWADRGGVGVWMEERRQRSLSGGAPTEHVWRTMSVREELGIDWRVDDVVMVRLDGDQADVKATVKAVENPRSPRGEAGEFRLTLALAK